MIYAVMPVFNRLQMTSAMLECLSQQHVDEAMHVIVVDDGSTDGTAEYLATRSELTILKGNGDLWWGGAVDLAIRHVLCSAKSDDWVLLINNDTQIDTDFVQWLLNAALRNPKSAVGSVVRNKPDGGWLTIGPLINAERLTIRDYLDQPDVVLPPDSTNQPWEWEVDALSGRGVLLPVSGLRAVGGMRPRWLPHYMADYEVSVRLKSHGWRLIVSAQAVAFSTAEFGNQYRSRSLREKFWSVRSPSYLPALICFWWEVSTWWQRLTLPFRLVIYLAFPSLRKNK